MKVSYVKLFQISKNILYFSWYWLLTSQKTLKVEKSTQISTTIFQNMQFSRKGLVEFF